MRKIILRCANGCRLTIVNYSRKMGRRGQQGKKPAVRTCLFLEAVDGLKKHATSVSETPKTQRMDSGGGGGGGVERTENEIV